MLRISSALLCALIATSCDGQADDPLDPRPEVHGTSLGADAIGVRVRPWTLDDEFARVAREDLPGFAGRYQDSIGRHVVLITDPAYRQSAIDYIDAHNASRHMSTMEPDVRIVAYDARQLLAWKQAATTLFGSHLIHSIDIDEVDNTLSIGADSASLERVFAAATDLGIPAGALHIYGTGRSEPIVSLRDRHRSVTPGFRIENTKGEGCTIGMNGYLFGGSPLFITASHCSAVPYADEGRLFFQNKLNDSDAIGWELKDVGPYMCDPLEPAVTNCRWSDAAYVSFFDTVAWRRGVIARTTGFGSNVVSGAFGTGAIPVVGELPQGDLEVGLSLHRLGQVSGWTKGSIKKTCVTEADWTQVTGPILFNCQYRVWKSEALPGDSGGPVFYYSGWTGEALFAGVATRRGIIDGEPFFSFSPIAGIEADLGSFAP